MTLGFIYLFTAICIQQSSTQAPGRGIVSVKLMCGIDCHVELTCRIFQIIQ